MVYGYLPILHVHIYDNHFCHKNGALTLYLLSEKKEEKKHFKYYRSQYTTLKHSHVTVDCDDIVMNLFSKERLYFRNIFHIKMYELFLIE